MSTLSDAATVICDAIDRELTTIIPDFVQHAALGPWPVLDKLPPRPSLERLIRLVIEVALRHPDPPDIQHLLHAAADYGLARFHQGLSEASLFYDFDVLRQTLWHYIRDRTDLTGILPLEAIIRVDHALTFAAPAALRGFHRLQFDARGQWPRVLDELENQWTPLPPIG